MIIYLRFINRLKKIYILHNFVFLNTTMVFPLEGSAENGSEYVELSKMHAKKDIICNCSWIFSSETHTKLWKNKFCLKYVSRLTYLTIGYYPLSHSNKSCQKIRKAQNVWSIRTNFSNIFSGNPLKLFKLKLSETPYIRFCSPSKPPSPRSFSYDWFQKYCRLKSSVFFETYAKTNSIFWSF